jgi:hypothetical protein
MTLMLLSACASLKRSGAQLERPVLEYGWHCEFVVEADGEERALCCMVQEDMVKLMHYMLILEKR